MVSLKQTELATNEDRANGIDKWAKLFKANTWEELKMIAQNNESMTSAAESIFLSNQDYNIRKVIRERQEHERYVEKLKTDREKALKVIAAKDKALADKDKINAEQKKIIDDLQAQLKEALDQLHDQSKDKTE